MYLKTHGGQCCGIKVIHALGEDHSDGWQDELVEKPIPGDHTMSDCFEYQIPGQNFFFEAAPGESSLDRLKRYVDYCKRHRPKHLIEIVLNDEQTGWFRDVRELGFKMVSEFENSNSGQTCYVYHLIYGQGE